MRTIYLLRHAHAVLPDSNGKDFDRALSKSGKVDAANQVQRLIKAGISPDCILFSPATRTMQTADIFSTALNKAYPDTAVILQAVPSLYRADAHGYIDEIRLQAPETANCIIVVGHNPSIEDCALLFTQNNEQLAQRISDGFPTAGLAKIETNAAFAEISQHNAELTALYLPHED